jgi:hypothetical protein
MTLINPHWETRRKETQNTQVTVLIKLFFDVKKNVFKNQILVCNIKKPS